MVPPNAVCVYLELTVLERLELVVDELRIADYHFSPVCKTEVPLSPMVLLRHTSKSICIGSRGTSNKEIQCSIQLRPVLAPDLKNEPYLVLTPVLGVG